MDETATPDAGTGEPVDVAQPEGLAADADLLSAEGPGSTDRPSPDETPGPAEPPPGMRLSIDDGEHPGREMVVLISWAVVLACCALVFWSLNPPLIFQNSTPTGGDMGAHVWGPRFLQDHLLTEGRVTGWTQDWYAGFPAYVFYMVVPSLMIVWLAAGSSIWDGSTTEIVLALLIRAVLFGGLVVGLRLAPRRVGDHWARPLLWIAAVFVGVLLVPIPYNIAFKLVTVSGLVTLPIGGYALARAARVPFPGPPLIAIATLGFIYDKGFTILGGNGASTMAGEFAFSISLTLSLLYLAVVFRGVRTGRDRALGAVLFALTILCHLIPAIFAFIATVILLFVRREDRTPWWDANTAGRVVASVLVVFTLLLVVPGDRVPLVGGVLDTWFRQWWFPAVASLLALALFTNFQPRPLQVWRGPQGRRAALGTALVLGGSLLVLLALGLVSPSPWFWVLVVLIAVMVAFAGWDSRLLRWGIVVGPIGFLLSCWWFLPFVGNSTYMNDMGWEKYTRYLQHLVADPIPELGLSGMPYRNIVFALAGLGVLLSLVHRARFGYFLALTVLSFAWIFRYFPQYRLWNARLLPFYYLAIYLLAALAVALVIRSIAIAVQELRGRRDEPVLVGAIGLGVVATLMAVVFLGAFGWLPGGTSTTSAGDPSRPVYRWMGIEFETTIVPGWATYNYSGLDNKPAFPEFSGVVDMMGEIGEDNGCGRAMWEYERELDRFGTPMALMLLPYFTDGCIGSMEGLYFESSSTTPFHFLNQAELSVGPSSAQRDLPYSGFDIDRGVAHLQLMGVRYYMATTDQAITAARGSDLLTELEDRSFPYTDATGQRVENRWVVFEVDDADIVTPLERTPVVLTDADDHIDGWVYAAEEPAELEDGRRASKDPGPAVQWYLDPTRWDVLLATSGPQDWLREPSERMLGPATPLLDDEPLPPVEVSDVELTQNSISFSVDEVGVPVLVRVSYFPNWTAAGADGPYRVTPNFMVVVPTEQQVTLSYGRSRWDLLGWVATLIGLALLAVVAAHEHRRRPEPLDEEGASEPVDPLDPDPTVDAAVESPEDAASTPVT